MPFAAIKKGRKKRIVIEVKGPREAKQGKKLKAALRALLKKHSATIKSSTRTKKRRRR
jgi:hypothetical protein